MKAILPSDRRSRDESAARRLAALLGERRAVVLSGAGCSTESGIPDYRGPDGRLRKRLPMRYQEFVGDARSRARYWARSAVGWPRFSAARPNAAHRAMARLEAMGRICGVITQNVDGLHQAGGSRTVLELHGALARVLCLGCGATGRRDALQHRLEALNPELRGWTGASAPDGDAVLPDEVADSLRVPGCTSCGGMLKPDVVFFGENVPRARVDEAWSLFGRGELLLVAGSSLQVYSGRRFADRARRAGIPVVIANLGPTRADESARLKVEAPLGAVLSEVVRELET